MHLKFCGNDNNDKNTLFKHSEQCAAREELLKSKELLAKI